MNTRFAAALMIALFTSPAFASSHAAQILSCAPLSPGNGTVSLGQVPSSIVGDHTPYLNVEDVIEGDLALGYNTGNPQRFEGARDLGNSIELVYNNDTSSIGRDAKFTITLDKALLQVGGTGRVHVEGVMKNDRSGPESASYAGDTSCTATAALQL